MTTVHISLGRDDGTDQTAAKGVVEWEPTTRREDGTMVILERGFTVPLVAGEASVTVDPSGLTWCWRVTERTDSGGTVRYVSVPDSAAVVEYVDLPDVDPTTLVAWSPADPEAAYLASLGTAVDDYLLANPVSAPVDSVNGQTGAVALDAADVGADPAGTAAWLVGALVIPDSPDDIGAAAVAHTHAPGDVTGTAVITTDPRLSDARTPTAHTHTLAAITDAGDAAGLDVGTTAGTVMAGDDSRVTSLSSTYAALNHAARHATGQPDAITPASIGAQPAGSYAPALGADDNYVTDAEKAALHSHANKAALDQVYYAAGRPDIPGTLDPAALAWRDAAPSGSTFYSTDGPQGAWVWRKRGASWGCVEGDTGWRTTYDYTQDEATWSTGTIQIRRINESVSIRFLNITCTAGTGPAVAAGVASAIGFRVPVTTTRTHAGLLALNASPTLLRVQVINGDVYYYGPHTNTGSSFARSAQVLRGVLGWMTDDTTWPTALPGSPA